MRPPDHWHVRPHRPRRNRRIPPRPDPWRLQESRSLSRKQLRARPPDLWRVPEPRSRNAWWPAVALVAFFAVAGLLVCRLAPSGGEGTADPSRVSEVLSSECVAGLDCRAQEGAGTYVESSAAAPEITARAAAVFEAPCDTLLYGRNLHQRLAPASLTKMATALVAAERSDLSRATVVDVNSGLLAASTNSTVMGLEPGMELSLRDLLYGLLLPSGNDAAIAIAQAIGGSVPAFVQMMNAKAAALGLADTHFTNPHGLDETGLYTSAYDIALLGQAVLDDADLAVIVQTKSYQPLWDGPPVWNGNALLNTYPDAIGVKIGYTEKAGQTMVAAASRNGRRIIVSILGSWDRYSDASRLLDWAFDQTAPACAAASTAR